jgi:hypothetical protein
MATYEGLTFRHIREQALRGEVVAEQLIRQAHPDIVSIDEVFSVLESGVCRDERAARTAVWELVGSGVVKIVNGNSLTVNN